MQRRWRCIYRRAYPDPQQSPARMSPTDSRENNPSSCDPALSPITTFPAKRLRSIQRDQPKPDLLAPGSPLWDAMTIEVKHIPDLPSTPNRALTPRRSPRTRPATILSATRIPHEHRRFSGCATGPGPRSRGGKNMPRDHTGTRRTRQVSLMSISRNAPWGRAPGRRTRSARPPILQAFAATRALAADA